MIREMIDDNETKQTEQEKTAKPSVEDIVSINIILESLLALAVYRSQKLILRPLKC